MVSVCVCDVIFKPRTHKHTCGILHIQIRRFIQINCQIKWLYEYNVVHHIYARSQVVNSQLHAAICWIRAPEHLLH